MTLAQIQQSRETILSRSTISIGNAFGAAMPAGGSFIITTSGVIIRHLQVHAYGMLSFLESVAVVQLDTPALLTGSALDEVCAFRLAIAPCINLCNATTKAKLR